MASAMDLGLSLSCQKLHAYNYKVLMSTPTSNVHDYTNYDGRFAARHGCG